jgi:5-oxopent-3-ene-1,2,5-tricarboxylate decarboxylase / 2-hydroxyhepta-2,4-diene-1,7-dioate isomerase
MTANTTRLIAGVPICGTVVGTLLNFRGALDRMNPRMHEPPYKAPPRAPVLYIKPQNTWAAHGKDIEVPADVTEVEIGVTLGIVIGRSASRVPASRALDYVAGYVVVNDLTVPHQNVFRPAIKARCRDGFCPIGATVISGDAVGDPDALALRAYVNGELRQENNTCNLVRPVAQLIADVSEFMTLAAGDVLLAGVPESAPVATAGDRVTVEVERVGLVENMLVAERRSR